MADWQPQYSLADLQFLMRRLRDPEGGCPWDLKQDFKSIVSHTLEEAYEVADAIERENKHDLMDELGDLLFQVVFYSQLGAEEGSFDMGGVIDNVTRKLLRRHPHVFPNQDLHAYFPQGSTFNDNEIKAQWETIKAQERALKKAPQEEVSNNPASSFNPVEDSILSDVPAVLPAMNRAEKLQKRASQVGFDWQDLPPVLEKLEEEIAELKVEILAAKGKDFRAPEIHQRLQDEMGDVLFSCVNLSRFLKVSPDAAMRASNLKFTLRFQYIEAQLKANNSQFSDMRLADLEALWETAKQSLSGTVSSS